MSSRPAATALLDGVVAQWAALAARSRIRPVGESPRDLVLEVIEARDLAAGVRLIRLGASDGSELPAWDEGAHIDVVLPSGRIRQYSLCGDREDRSEYRIAVRRLPAGGGGSLEVHTLAPGDRLGVRGPRNAFPFAYPHLARREIDDVVFIAAGIGITALLPMVRAAAHAGVPWRLVYVGRDRASMPFLDELEAGGAGSVRILLGRPEADDVLADVAARTSVYFCGPPPFLEAIQVALARREHAGFHFERFVPPAVVGGAPFALRLASTGRQVSVRADESALAALRTVQPDAPYSCQQGYCGTCRVRVVSGEVERRGTSMFRAGEQTMLPCVDRAVGECITIEA